MNFRQIVFLTHLLCLFKLHIVQKDSLRVLMDSSEVKLFHALEGGSSAPLFNSTAANLGWLESQTSRCKNGAEVVLAGVIFCVCVLWLLVFFYYDIRQLLLFYGFLVDIDWSLGCVK